MNVRKQNFKTELSLNANIKQTNVNLKEGCARECARGALWSALSFIIKDMLWDDAVHHLEEGKSLSIILLGV